MKLLAALTLAGIMAAPIGASTDPLFALFGKPVGYGKVTFQGRPFVCAQWNFTAGGRVVRVVTECVAETVKPKGKAVPGAA